MFHPLQGDLSALKDSEVEERLSSLIKKYNFAARTNNYTLLTQIQTFVNIYRDELSRRYQKNLSQNSYDKDLDQLINVE